MMRDTLGCLAVVAVMFGVVVLLAEVGTRIGGPLLAGGLIFGVAWFFTRADASTRDRDRDPRPWDS